MPAKDKRHHAWPYPRDAARVRARAYANPMTRCWRCGMTLRECAPHKNGKPARWMAGHIIDGLIGGPLAAECSPCNQRAGGDLRQGKLRELREPHTAW